MLSFLRVCLLMPCGHLLGKGWPIGSRLVMSNCECVTFPLVSWVRCGTWFIDLWSLPSLLLWYIVHDCDLLFDALRTSHKFLSHFGRSPLSSWYEPVTIFSRISSVWPAVWMFPALPLKDISPCLYWRQLIISLPPSNLHMCRDMWFPTMWYVWPAEAQTSLRIRAVWSEPWLVSLIF